MIFSIIKAVELNSFIFSNLNFSIIICLYAIIFRMDCFRHKENILETYYKNKIDCFSFSFTSKIANFIFI